MQALQMGDFGKRADAQRQLTGLSLSRLTELLPFLLKRVYSGLVRIGCGIASACCVRHRFWAARRQTSRLPLDTLHLYLQVYPFAGLADISSYFIQLRRAANCA
jgi:hypothetical protein